MIFLILYLSFLFFFNKKKTAKVFIENIPDPIWILGFTEGEGSFIINKQNRGTDQLKKIVWLEFSLTQHNRDQELLEKIKVYLGCGNVYPKSENKYFVYRVSKFDDNFTKIIPFFS